MPYYRKIIALDLNVPVAVEADNVEEAKEMIESINLDGKTIKIEAKNIVEKYPLPEDIPDEISKELYERTKVKIKKK